MTTECGIARVSAASWQKCAAHHGDWEESPPERGESAVAGSITPAVVPGKYDIVTTLLFENQGGGARRADKQKTHPLPGVPNWFLFIMVSYQAEFL